MTQRKVGLSERHLKKAGYKKATSKFDPWASPLAADAANLTMMQIGSGTLLKRLWQEHPGILRHHHQAGRLVIRP